VGNSGFIKATLKGGLLFLVPVAFLAIILGAGESKHSTRNGARP
jgi:hypothetical protein